MKKKEKDERKRMGKGYEYKEIGHRIKELRGSDRQKDWARKIGCDQGYISQVENGVTKPSLAFLKGVAAITNASIDWILTSRGNKSMGLARHKEVDVYLPSGYVVDPDIKSGIDRILRMDASGRSLIKAIGEMDAEKVDCLTALLAKSRK